MEKNKNNYGLTDEDVKYLERTGFTGLVEALVYLIQMGDTKAREIFDRIRDNIMTSSAAKIEAALKENNM